MSCMNNQFRSDAAGSYRYVFTGVILICCLFSPSRVCSQPAVQSSSTSVVTGDAQPKNMLLYDKYGDLLNDDTVYYKKCPFWRPVAGIFAQEAVVWGSDRYVSNYPYSRIGLNTWSKNIKNGFSWDNDGLNMNFFLHPISGAGYFNFARSCGYNFGESALCTAGGSLLWEYFGENTSPSYDDLINTTVTGTFFGEMLYRLSSDILDDSATGSERTWREIAAGVVDPPRCLNRLWDGMTSSVSTGEVYQKKPLNIELSGGMRMINNKGHFGGATKDEVYGLKLEYGDPFEDRPFKPFDFFTLRGEIGSDPGVNSRGLGSIVGYGLLYGKNTGCGYGNITQWKNIRCESSDTLLGIFQHYDYWDNATFEMTTLAFGPGVISQKPLAGDSMLYSALHLGAIPLAGTNTQFGPFSSSKRDYNYGDGAEAKFECGLKFRDRIDADFVGYYYWIHTYVGTAGDNFVGIIKPRITFRIFDRFSIGYEHQVYYDNRISRYLPNVNLVRTEQRIFVSFYLEDMKYRE